MTKWIAVLVAVGACGIASIARAENFKSIRECVVGTAVETSNGNRGRITRIEDPLCFVQHEGGGREVTYIFWMLNAAGGSRETNDALVVGVYECFAGGRYTFMDMKITGPSTYESAGEAGRFHVEPSRKIVFESGPLAPYFSKLLDGPRIGLNTTGDSFYATTCELNRAKR